METSAAISKRVEQQPARARAELDDDTAAALAHTLTRWTLRGRRLLGVCLIAPIAACASLSTAAPDASVLFFWGALVCMPFAALPSFILRAIARRGIADDVRLLGFDEATVKHTLKVFDRVTRSGAHLTRASKEHATKEALVRSR